MNQLALPYYSKANYFCWIDRNWINCLQEGLFTEQFTYSYSSTEQIQMLLEQDEAISEQMKQLNPPILDHALVMQY